MNVLILEDEQPAARRLQQLVTKLRPESKVVGVLRSVADAMAWFEQNLSPDLVLMDIELTDGQSFAVFDAVPIACPVIFTTAYDEYMLKAFKSNGIDYLLKPIDEDELAKSLQKYDNLRRLFSPTTPAPNMAGLLGQLQQAMRTNTFRERFLIKAGQRYMTVETVDIACFRAAEKQVYLYHTDGRELVVDYSLDELESMLNPRDFFRANRQYLLSAKAIKSMHAGFNGKMIVIPDVKVKLEISIPRERVKAFKEWAGA